MGSKESFLPTGEGVFSKEFIQSFLPTGGGGCPFLGAGGGG